MGQAQLIWLLPLFQFHFYSLSCQPRLFQSFRSLSQDQASLLLAPNAGPNPGQSRFQVGA